MKRWVIHEFFGCLLFVFGVAASSHNPISVHSASRHEVTSAILAVQTPSASGRVDTEQIGRRAGQLVKQDKRIGACHPSVTDHEEEQRL